MIAAVIIRRRHQTSKFTKRNINTATMVKEEATAINKAIIPTIISNGKSRAILTTTNIVQMLEKMGSEVKEENEATTMQEEAVNTTAKMIRVRKNGNNGAEDSPIRITVIILHNTTIIAETITITKAAIKLRTQV